jgi:hypothetical protein
VLDIVDRFASLNPYDHAIIPGSILEIESENFDPATKKQRAINCLAVAAKRYGLFLFGPDGRPVLIGKPEKRRRSEHGLGHLLLPEHPELGTGPYLDQWWEHTICTELGIANDEPNWFNDEAIGRLTVTSQHEERAFRAYNKALPYEERVRPWNFEGDEAIAFAYIERSCPGCGRSVTGRRKWCSDACRKRLSRREHRRFEYLERESHEA